MKSRQKCTQNSMKSINGLVKERSVFFKPNVMIVQRDHSIHCIALNSLWPDIHTSGCYSVSYIIGHYKPSVRIIDLVSNTTYVVCVNFIHKWRDIQLKVDSERQISRETFHGNSYLSLRVFARNLVRGNRRRNNN